MTDTVLAQLPRTTELNHKVKVGDLLRSSWLVFAVAFSVRLALVFGTKSYLQVEHTEIVRVATSLARHSAFADAFGPHTGRTAHVSPLYPIVLSVVFRVFGTGLAGEIAQEILSSLIASLTYAILPLLSSAAGVDAAIGGLAGIVGGAVPVNFWSETKGSFEASLAGLMMAAFCLITCRYWRSQDFSVVTGAITGLISGFGLLVSPSLAPVVLTCLTQGFLLFTARKQYLLFVATAVITSALCLAPWVLRNQRALGGAVWTRSGLGLELSISNNDVANANWLDNIDSGWFQRSHPYYSRVERESLAAVGELAYNREKMRAALQWIAAHPKHFSELCLERAYYFWFPKMRRPIQRILMAFFAIGGWIGVALALRHRIRAGWVFASLLVTYPLVYYLVESFARYRTPIDGLLIFLTIFGGWYAFSPKTGRLPSADSQEGTSSSHENCAGEVA
jgi:hypothetical protein